MLRSPQRLRLQPPLRLPTAAHRAPSEAQSEARSHGEAAGNEGQRPRRIFGIRRRFEVRVQRAARSPEVESGVLVGAYHSCFALAACVRQRMKCLIISK